ncbi:MAG TPA: hypothetical protein VJC16_06025 [Candidatus Nanoarchaeia archaeon]|nr:hypothetical protein [Candidatus Nanoarchaeia archaeon]
MSKNRRKILAFFFFFLLLAAVSVYQPVIQANVIGAGNGGRMLVYDIAVLALLAATIVAGLAGHFTRHVEAGKAAVAEAPALSHDALQKLQEYITYCSSQGMKETEITKTLQHYGWEEMHIENALTSLKLGRAAPSFREMFKE